MTVTGTYISVLSLIGLGLLTLFYCGFACGYAAAIRAIKDKP